MDLNLSQIGSIIGSQSTRQSNVYDLVNTQNLTGIETSLSSQLLSTETELTDTQVASLANIRSFIDENVDPDTAGELFESLAALENLLTLNNESSANLDPIFSLLTENQGLNESLALGSLLDISA